MLCFSDWKQWYVLHNYVNFFPENCMVLEHNCPQFPIQNIIFLFPHYTYTSKLWRCIEGTTLLPLYLLYFWSYFQTKKSSLTFYVWLKVFSTWKWVLNKQCNCKTKTFALTELNIFINILLWDTKKYFFSSAL